MKIYIIGICGTFMGGLARLAREMDIQVSGSDANTYPPMSTQLESLDIELFEGYKASNVATDADMIVVGNTVSRGNPELEFVLDKGLAYTSGAQWLHDTVLADKWVLAVAGTHGKTTTASILTWLLEANNMQPGFLIGGVPENFSVSSRIGGSPFFVIEADEYDTAFCDKRSKFVHYQPRTLILNNLEFDHADIFADLAAIQLQFHHLLRIVPQSGQVIYNQHAPAIDQVLDMGCWSEQKSFALANDNKQESENNADWQCKKTNADASQFDVIHKGKHYPVQWSLIGEHNMCNGLAAVAAAHHVGVPISLAVESLAEFKSVKRRLELIFEKNNICVYDDFAHHPTAIKGTLQALRNKVGDARIIAILEPRSNTMKQGVHKHLLAQSLTDANNVLVYADAQVKWDINILQSPEDNIQTFDSTQKLLDQTLNMAQPGDHILIMSNGGFDGFHQRLMTQLSNASLDTN